MPELTPIPRIDRLLAVILLIGCSATEGASEPTSDPSYGGLDRDAVRRVVADEKRAEELFRELTAVDAGGVHGGHHEIKLHRERELSTILERLPRYPGALKILLRAIDQVYLRHHDNGYHGWIWHWPYFDCRKAVALADRLIRDHPNSVEEALWTKIYCYRIKGLDGTAYPYKGEWRNYPTVHAQTRWKSDPGMVRALCREYQDAFPKGKYAIRAAELLNLKDLEVTLPDVWDKPGPILLDRR